MKKSIYSSPLCEVEAISEASVLCISFTGENESFERILLGI